MRVTSLLRKLIGIPGLRVTDVLVEGGALVARVRPNWRDPRCSRCGKCPSGQGRGGAVAHADRRWRHLDLAGARLELSYDVRWVYCPDCGRCVEQVPWASEARTRFTEAFDEHAAYLAQRSDKTSVARLLRIHWETVGACVARTFRRLAPEGPLKGLTVIGVDELSYRKHHRYLTLVADHASRRIVWGKEGKSAETLAAFFEELGEEGRRRIQAVCVDLGPAYVKAVREAVPHAEIVFDRFHVQRLASDALDETRREEWRRLRGTDEAHWIKGTRWALLRSPLTLSDAEGVKLATIARQNRRLYRAYLLKEELADILDRRQPNVVRLLLGKWCGWASRSRLPAFTKVAKTIRKHMDGIVAYVRWRVTNGLSEGLNNKARLITRRAYGFHSAEAALAMIMLCCSSIEVHPQLRALAA